MCGACEKLVKCDKGHKAKVVIVPGTCFTDCFGEEWFADDVFMGIDHDEVANEAFAYIAGGAFYRIKIPSVCYANSPVDIRYCPFCGEKLY